MKKLSLAVFVFALIALGTRFLAKECIKQTSTGQSALARKSLGIWTSISKSFFSENSGFSCPKFLAADTCQQAHQRILLSLTSGNKFADTVIQNIDGKAGVFVYGTQETVAIVIIGFHGDKNRETESLGLKFQLKEFGTYVVLGKPTQEKTPKFMIDLRKDGKFPTGQYSLRIYKDHTFKDMIAIKRFILNTESLIQ